MKPVARATFEDGRTFIVTYPGAEADKDNVEMMSLFAVVVEFTCQGIANGLDLAGMCEFIDKVKLQAWPKAEHEEMAALGKKLITSIWPQFVAQDPSIQSTVH